MHPIAVPEQTVTDWAAPVSLGRMVLLDTRNATLSVLDSSGTLLSRTGRKGRGPGEWVAPVQAVAVEDSAVLVLDPPTARLFSFILSGDSLKLVDTRPVPVNPQATCKSRDRVLVMASLPTGLLHRIDGKGAVLQSLARARLDDPSGGDLSAVGWLVCDMTSATTVSSVFGTLHRFDLESGQVDSTSIPGFLSTRYLVKDGRMSPTPPPGETAVEIVQAVFATAAGLVVQVERRGPASQVTPERRTLLYDQATRRWQRIARALPAVVGASRSVVVFRESAADGDRLFRLPARALQQAVVP